MSSIFLAFIGHMPFGKAFSFHRSGILFGTERSLKGVCEEAINEICGDVLGSGNCIHTYNTLKWKN
jgi:hypothetical protein